MKLCFAGVQEKRYKHLFSDCKYFLESFYYFREWQMEFVKKSELYLMDSGAYTFMASKDNQVIDFDKYVKDYAYFINDHGFNYFFELDIDSVKGYKAVIEYRKMLESLTRKKCIPVWHKSRGIEEYEKLTKEYSYIGIGGFVVNEITPKDFKYIPKLLKHAQKNRCRVHGLGFTNKDLYKYNFYSVDSTSWNMGKRFLEINRFDGQKIVRQNMSGKFQCNDTTKLTQYNIAEWIKYQKYLEKKGYTESWKVN